MTWPGYWVGVWESQGATSLGWLLASVAYDVLCWFPRDESRDVTRTHAVDVAARWESHRVEYPGFMSLAPT